MSEGHRRRTTVTRNSLHQLLAASVLGPGDGAMPDARPGKLLWQAIGLYVSLVLLPTLMLNVLLPTPLSVLQTEGHIVVVVSAVILCIWLSLSLYFFNLFRSTWRTEPRLAMVLGVLTLDSFRNVIESAYFGIAYSGWINLIPSRYMRLLWAPQAMIVSRLLGMATALLILLLVLDRGFESLKLREQRTALLEQRNRELAALQELAALLSGTLDRRAVLETVCREIVEALSFQSALLCLVDASDGVLYGAAGFGIPPAVVAATRSSLDSSNALARAAQAGETRVVVEGPEDAPTLIRVIAPIGDEEGPVGAVEATVGPPAPDHHRLALLHSFLRHACTAIRNARLHETVLTDRERLNSLTRTLEDQNKQLESFVYMVSHDLKAPLVSMQGFLSLLDSEYRPTLGEEGQFYVDRLRGNAQHLQQLIRQLLDLSRAGKVDSVVQPVDIESLVAEAIGELQPLLQRLHIQARVDGRLPAALGDASQIRQIFQNLLDNSVKFMGTASTREIVVSGVRAGDEVEYTVRDFGAGIPEDLHERVFQMFQRVFTTGQTVEGTGVGLAIVRKIAESHGGRAWAAAPNDGPGIEFHVRLPSAPEGIVERRSSPETGSAGSEETRSLEHIAG